MPDNEIVKALDICSKSTNGCSHSKYTCEDCYLNGQTMCSAVLLQDAIDCFNCLQAEKEEMRKGLEEVVKGIEETKALVARDIAKAKAEAYKEFAESLKKKAIYSGLVNADIVYECDIDNLLKKLVGDSQ